MPSPRQRLGFDNRPTKSTACSLRARGDLVFELLDPGTVWNAIEDAPDAGTYRGVWQARGTGKGSGVATEINYAGTYRFGADDRIVEVNEFATRDEAVAAASQP